jgi:hypothetical protein
VAIRNHGIDVKLRSVWSYPVSVWVYDTPRRLNELGYHLEAYSGKKGERLKAPQGRVFVTWNLNSSKLAKGVLTHFLLLSILRLLAEVRA